MHHVDQIRLRGHDGVYVLVGCRRLVKNVFVLAAFHTFSGSTMVGQGEAAFGISTAHDTAGAM